MKSLLPLLFLFYSLQLIAQNTYVVKQITGEATYEVYQLILNPDTSLVLQFEFNPAADCKDIAISPSGEFYGVGVEGIYKINENNGTTTIIGVIPQTGIYTSLICSNDNFLYTLNYDGHLYKFDITNASFELVTQFQGGSPGDLTFYKGNLIFQSSWDGNIKAFNLENESLVTIFCIPEPLNTTGQGFFGLSNNSDNCESLSFIASSSANDLYELDLENDTIVHLNISNPFLELKSLFLGTASTTEHFSSNCTFQFEDIECTPTVEKSFFVLGKTLEENVYHIYSLNQDQSLNFEYEFYSEFGCNDIAYTSNGFLYGIGTDNPATLFKINSVSKEVQEMITYPINKTIEAIVSDEINQIYSIDQDGAVYTYDFYCNTFSKSGNISEHAPTSDLAFKDNHLIFQSKSDGNIKALSISPLERSNILCVIPPYNDVSTGGFVGIANYIQDCELDILTGFNTENEMFELNYSTDTISQTSLNTDALFANVTIQGTAFKNTCNKIDADGDFQDNVCFTSLNSIDDNFNILISPNPFEDIISINSALHINQIVVYDSHGKILKKGNDQKINLEKLSKGIYFLNIQIGTENVVRKIIKN